MRFWLVTVTILLALASRGNGRPRDPDPLESSQEAVPRNGSPDTRKEQHRELKDIQAMDQSLRTVATQLLNATSKHEDLIRSPEQKIVTIETPIQVVHISTRVEDELIEPTSEENEPTKMKFGIPVNSKFGHLELSNPGHAMALTEEEIEREMATATTLSQKHQPTTASMLSTWIQLYPPSTTTEGNNVSEVKTDVQSNQIPTTSSTKLPIKSTTMVKPIRKTEPKQSTTYVEKSTEPSVSTTKIVKNSTTNFVKISTLSPTIENTVEESVKDKKPQNQRTTVSTTKSSTSKKPVKASTTPKPKVTGQKNSTSKPPKTNNPNRIKPFSTRRPAANKNDTVTSTSKIEKVTLKPSTVLLQNRTESTDKPLFITKIKASVLMDTQKITTTVPTSIKPISSIISKANFTTTETPITKVPSPTRVNNILKVHMKKPIDDTTKIEIHPIRVNPPVLTIEKIGVSNSEVKPVSKDQEVPQNSKIDIKFDFDPVSPNVEIKTSTEPSSTPSSTTTTKRPRGSNKRKKNKNRRRKPSTTTTTTLATPSDEESITLDNLGLEDIQTDIQESKIEPESKAPPSKKKKPNQTQVQKPIGTQIYNFLSREVMPSVGVMSLVGLGLGLASYFLYPFGGVISRRNYEVEPNYKYNLDEYGGNYGLSEEEVLSKVYSGMTGGQHHETKYNPADKNPNYYRYTGVDQPHTTRYPNLPSKNHGNRVNYRPVDTTSYDLSYRNTEFKYPDVPTTPNYYERQRNQQPSSDFLSTVDKVGIGKNRQFVVGNVPKEYASAELDKTGDVLPMQDKVDRVVPYQINDGYADNSPIATVSVENLGNPAALVSKVDVEQPPPEVYEEIEISPTAVAVEHGPRSLRSNSESRTIKRRKRSILPEITGSFIPLAIPMFKQPRIERSSVIQVIPSKSEIEKERKEEEQEEDLSNEILDIIDDAWPGKDSNQKKRYDGKDHATINKLHAMQKAATTTTSKTPSSTSSTTTTSTTTTTENGLKEAPLSTSTTSTSTTTTTTQPTPTEPDFIDQGETTLDYQENIKTTEKPKLPQSNGIDIFGIAKRIAEVKLRLGLTILKHASEGFARYIGHIQKRFNGEE